MKKGLLFVAFLVIAVVIAACSKGTVEASETYLLIEINPSIEFVIDEDDKVVSFAALNEDAEIVIGDLEFVGMAIEDALELYLEEAMNLGYLDVNREDNVILMTVYNEDEDEEENTRERYMEHAKGYLVRNRIAGAVVDSGLTMDDLILLAEEYDVSVGRIRIALAATLIDEELSLEDALAMPVRDIMANLRTEHQERIQQFRDERLQDRIQMREQMRQEAQTRVQEHLDNIDDMTTEQARQRVNEAHQAFLQNREEMMEAYRNRTNQRKDELRP